MVNIYTKSNKFHDIALIIWHKASTCTGFVFWNIEGIECVIILSFEGVNISGGTISLSKLSYGCHNSPETE